MVKKSDRDGVFKRKDRAGWYVSYVSQGKRIKRRVQASTRTQALDHLRLLKTQEERYEALGVRPQTEMTLAELLKDFRRRQKATLRPTSLKRLDGVIPVLCEGFPEQVKTLTRRDVADFVARRLEKVSPATVFKETTVLKHCLRLAVEDGLLHANVAQGVKLPKVSEGRTRYLSPAELKHALEAAPEWLRGPIAFAAATGMRRGEILSLKWSEVDLENRIAYLLKTKNNRLRPVVLNDLAMRVLLSLDTPRNGRVFGELDPMRVTDNTRHLFARLGIEGASYHSLRHTAAAWLAMEGVPLHSIGTMLGHETPMMTKRYAHLAPDYMRTAAGKLDNVFGELYVSKSGDAVGTIIDAKASKPIQRLTNERGA